MLKLLVGLAILGLILTLSACTSPSPTPDIESTIIAILTQTASQIILPSPLASTTPIPTATNTPVPVTATPRNPTVIKDSLCWVGPGSQYEVVSAIRNGTPVDLLGRGSISGWWIVRNPIYKDPCWIQEGNLQIDPSFDTSVLQVFYPPPTPTWTPSITPSPTP